METGRGKPGHSMPAEPTERGEHMSDKHEIEVWIVMDSDGDYAVGADRDNAIENFENEIGNPAGARIVCLRTKMAAPEESEIDVEVPDTAGSTVEVEAA